MPLVKPHSPEDFAAALQHALDHCSMLTLDPDTRLEFTKPLLFHPRPSSFPTGLSAYGAQLTWRSDGTYDKAMLRFETQPGQESSNFTLEGVSILGDATCGSAPPCGHLIEVIGRSGCAIRGFLIKDFNWEQGSTALWLEGEVFEGYVVRPKGTWVRDASIVCRHGYEIEGVMSNIYIMQPNITRCPAWLGRAIGILCDRCCSVLIHDGNFIGLDGPAIKGTNGVKRIVSCDFENTGNTNGAAIEIDNNDFWSQVIMCEGSNTTGYMKYLLNYGGQPDRLDVEHCRMYGGEVMAPEGHPRCVVEGHRDV